MPAYKEGNGTWTARVYYTNFYGERKQKNKRGFSTKREALEFEREFLSKCMFSVSMSFKSLYELYMEDLSHRLRLNTVLTKKTLIELKLLPFFGKMSIDKITPVVIRKWQNNLMTTINPSSGSVYSQTYIKTINNQLVAIFNYAIKFHNLKENPCHKAGSIGKKQGSEMLIWTVDEFYSFISFLKHKPIDYTGFNILFWCGIRIGELLALTVGDINFEKGTINIDKSYQRIKGEDVITEPKTPKSIRVVEMPPQLIEIIKEYITKMFKPKIDSRLFNCTKYTFEHSMKYYSAKANVKRIRIHDLRHSHASLLIHLGISPIAVSRRLGHEKVETTLNTYSHLYPSTNSDMIISLDELKKDL